MIQAAYHQAVFTLQQLSITQTLVIGALVGLVVYMLIKKRRHHLPPGPVPLPVLGNLLLMRNKDEAFYETLARWAKEKYGPVVMVHFGPVPCVTLNSLEVVTEALVDKAADYAGRPMLHSLSVLSQGFKNILFSGDVNSLKYQRKVVMQALRHCLRDQHLEMIVHKVVSATIDKMLAEPAAFDPHPYIRSMVFQIINTVCFGEDTKPLEDTGYKRVMYMFDGFNDALGNGFLEDVIPLLKYWPTRKFTTAVSVFREFLKYINENINLHRKTFSPNTIRDLADSMLLAQREVAREGSAGVKVAFTDTHVGQTVTDMFAAGWDTTRQAVEWAMFFLAGHSEIQKRAQKEVDSVSEKDGLPGLSVRDHLQYTEATLQETLRLGTVLPVAVPRRTLCDTTVGGYHVPKDTMVLINSWALLHDPEKWDQPQEFRPERFLDDHGQVKPPRTNGWDPFSAGRRACAGEAFSRPLLLLVLACLLRRVHISLPQGVTFDSGYLPTAGISLHAPKPYRIVVTARH